MRFKGRMRGGEWNRTFALALPPVAAAAANRVNAPFTRRPAVVSKIIAVVVTPSPVQSEVPSKQMCVAHRKETKGKLR